MAVEEAKFSCHFANKLSLSQSLPTGGFHYGYFESSLNSSKFLDSTANPYSIKPDPSFVRSLTNISKRPLTYDTINSNDETCNNAENIVQVCAQTWHLEESADSEDIAECSHSFNQFTFLLDHFDENIRSSIAKQIKTLSGNMAYSLTDKVTHIVTKRTTQEVQSLLEASQTFLQRLQKQRVKLWSLNKMETILHELNRLSKSVEQPDQSERISSQQHAQPVYFEELFLLVEDITGDNCPIMADDIVVPTDLGSRSPVWDYVIRKNPQWTHLLPEENCHEKKKPKRPRRHKNGKITPGKLSKARKKTPVIKKKMRGYCENCDVLFECMEEHLQNSTHHQLSTIQSRFDDLDSVLSAVQRIEIS
ncbi:Cdc7p-Dbf4p kinase complex regulatory subunit [Basidiobolus ranarum]|uniref:Cdc7p-Dbf4p kinase complex regulatory subunit n=1 Tax=Basidiobolus ranarum TaxID=34480 RepID=A0ABR2VWF1_9FUNG